MQWHDRDRISQLPVRKSLISLALPAVLSTFFSVIFEIVDMFWIGKLGASSIAALSGASFFIWMLRGLALTVSTGVLALVARRSGEKDEESLLETISHGLVSSFIFAIVIILAFIPVAIHIFKWIKLDPVVASLATDYSIVFLSGLVFVYLMVTIEFIIRGVGDTKTPMKIIGISLLLNVILDPLFIFHFKMGLKGAAIATIFSQCIGAIIMAIILLIKIPQLKSLRFSFQQLLSRVFARKFFTIIKIGGPIGLSDAGFSVIYLLLSGIISIFGKESLAAIGIAHRLEALPFFICLGFSMAVAPMVGQALGAKNIKDAIKSVSLALKITGGILLGISIFYYIFASDLFRFFTNNPIIINHGTNYLRVIALLEVFLAFEVVLSGAFSGAGDTKPPFLIIFPVTLLRIPGSYFFSVTLGYGVLAVWITIATTTAIKGILLFLYFKKGKWTRIRI